MFSGLDQEIDENVRFEGPNVVRGFLWVCVADLSKMSILRIHTISSNKRQGNFKDPYHIEVSDKSLSIPYVQSICSCYQ